MISRTKPSSNSCVAGRTRCQPEADADYMLCAPLNGTTIAAALHFCACALERRKTLIRVSTSCQNYFHVTVS